MTETAPPGDHGPGGDPYTTSEAAGGSRGTDRPRPRARERSVAQVDDATNGWRTWASGGAGRAAARRRRSRRRGAGAAEPRGAGRGRVTPGGSRGRRLGDWAATTRSPPDRSERRRPSHGIRRRCQAVGPVPDRRLLVRRRVVFEMARQLERSGDEVELLALLEPTLRTSQWRGEPARTFAACTSERSRLTRRRSASQARRMVAQARWVADFVGRQLRARCVGVVAGKGWRSTTCSCTT